MKNDRGTKVENLLWGKKTVSLVPTMVGGGKTKTKQTIEVRKNVRRELKTQSQRYLF